MDFCNGQIAAPFLNEVINSREKKSLFHISSWKNMYYRIRANKRPLLIKQPREHFIYVSLFCTLLQEKMLSDQYFHFEKLAIPMVSKWSFLHVLNDSRWFRTFLSTAMNIECFLKSSNFPFGNISLIAFFLILCSSVIRLITENKYMYNLSQYIIKQPKNYLRFGL